MLRNILLLTIFALSVVTSTFAQNEVLLANEYFDNNELDKAIELYEELAKKEKNLSAIHANYLTAMLRQEAFKDAEKYLKRRLKNEPLDARLNVDYGNMLLRKGEQSNSEKYFTDYLEKIKRDNSMLQYAAAFFIDEGLYEYAEQAFLIGRKNSKQYFFEELAELYAVWGKPKKMVGEYLQLLEADASQLEYVETMLQDNLTNEEEFNGLEPTLLQGVQKNPDKTVYNELLIWYYLQKQSFYKAFIQTRAIDKRKRLEGLKVFEIGKLALNNKAYKDAIRIFGFLVNKYANKPVYFNSRRLLVKSKEELVKNTYPVDMNEIRSLINDYQAIVQELGVRQNTADAMRSMAILQAFYLNNKDTAVTILSNIIQNPMLRGNLVSQAKLDLGDIYLLKGEPWEASLLYSQVEKAEKEQNLGHIAKLKNAKLSYYKGEFELAKAHLDVLKLATSREIANDAMDLSILIQDNLELDTSSTAMSKYAAIELLVFQNKYDEALNEYNGMLKAFKKHSLADEVMMEKASLLIKLGRFNEAVEVLQKVVDNHGNDIHADDANFMIGKLFEDSLNNPDKAMEYYQNQLLNYPGSIFNVEARKRFRRLRGDNLN